MRKGFARGCLPRRSIGDPEQTRYGRRGRGAFRMMMKQAIHHILSSRVPGKEIFGSSRIPGEAEFKCMF